MDKFLKAMHFRHACKVFDENKEIKQEDFLNILEAGRLSPSSMGMEPTRFIVVNDKKLKEELRTICWNQVQLTSASKVVVLKTLISPLMPPSNYVDSMSIRRGSTKEKREAWSKVYANFLESMQNKGISLQAWAQKQAYIAASSMMNYAAYIGIDSCPIEGFDIDNVNKILGCDTFKESVAIILTFGYRKKNNKNDIDLA
ncbi:NAD(P)H-dependent oxidoreductase [Helicobacter sp. MIT 99-5507]|uniref:NAD(P)H-dependent oxidoreductase n=1 Tax=Helicobacter sp. MIT 99-5507 TaxID=152489 RepID=UPI0021627783|nr:NAD(P)H-dependent oxidoreductase [Helicobacter sp. MIT 99-5507]